MKEKENTSTSKTKKLIYSVILAVCVFLLIAATVLTVYFVTTNQNEILDNPPTDNPDNPDNPDDPDGPDGPDGPDKPSVGDGQVAFIAPIKDATCTVEYLENWYNQSRDAYYWHQGIDYSADAGTEVYAMADGKVVSVVLNDVTGNSITIEHADGIQTIYRFVDAVQGLNAGDTVKQGQVIATVAEPYGTEYLDGTHLHLEMKVESKNVDPSKYIDQTLEEK